SQFTRLDLADATVSGNDITGTASGYGIFGDPFDELHITNTIVWGNSPVLTDDIAGYTITDVVFSDACTADQTGTVMPFSGPGNICADPLLVNPNPGAADVHQTSGSPTIDQGSNALVPPSLTTDYEGQARVVGSSVDMGADEFVPQAARTPQADLSIVKTDSPDPVQSGQELTYTLTVTNNGPDVATDTVVTDTLPSGVTLVRSSCGA